MQKVGFTARVIAAAAIALGFTVAAPAQNSTSFLATTGSDQNDCSAAAFCRTLAKALSATDAGREIVVVDSGSYGAATITRSVVINAIGVNALIEPTTGECAHHQHVRRRHDQRA